MNDDSDCLPHTRHGSGHHVRPDGYELPDHEAHPQTVEESSAEAMDNELEDGQLDPVPEDLEEEDGDGHSEAGS